MNRIIPLTVAAAMLAAGLAPAGAQEPPAELTIEERVQALEQALASLETRLEARTSLVPGTGTGAADAHRLDERIRRIESVVERFDSQLQRVERQAETALREANQARREATNAERLAREASLRPR